MDGLYLQYLINFKDLYPYSQAWAKVIAAKGSIDHSPESKAGKCGENVAYKGMPFAGAWGPCYLILMWYAI